MRAAEYLRETYPGSGIHICSPGRECKGGESAVPSAMTAMGMVGAIPGMAGAIMPVAGAAGAEAGGDLVTCALHGKLRKSNLCTQVLTEQGLQWQCTDSKRCKGGAPTASGVASVGMRYSPYGQPGRPMLVPIPGGEATGNQYYAVLNSAMWPGMGMMGGMSPFGIPGMATMAGAGALADGVSGTCALHGKRRTLANLIEAGPGLYRCKPGFECKNSDGTDGTNAMCSVHQRNRKIAFMTWDASTNSYRCNADNQCKVPTAK